MNAKDAMNVWKTRLIYHKNGIKRNTRAIPSGEVHDWLMANDIQIKYDFEYGAWAMNRVLSEKLIEEIEKL